MNFLKSLAAAFVFAIALALANFNPASAQGFSVQMQDGVAAGPSLSRFSEPSNGLYFGAGFVGVSKHLAAGSLATNNIPVLSACGTTPTLATGSTDFSGTITLGTTATGCVITFGTAYIAAPSCTVTWRATPLASQSYTISTSALTLTQTSTSNNLIDYTCVAKSGG